MASYKTGRVAGDIQRNLAEIFRELKDPRISQLLSVVKVDVSGDLSYAKIYVSAIEGEEKTAESVKGLKSAAGFIKRELSARCKLRKMPELTFIADNSIAHGAEIARIIEDFSADNNGNDDATEKENGNDN
ncbi:MAG: 30S ribosome-binding factor RbfA [Acutalibacteraceae bacterium]